MTYAPTREDVITAHFFARMASGEDEAKGRLMALASSGTARPDIDSRDGLWLTAFTNPMVRELSRDETKKCVLRARKFLTDEELLERASAQDQMLDRLDIADDKTIRYAAKEAGWTPDHKLTEREYLMSVCLSTEQMNEVTDNLAPWLLDPAVWSAQ